METYVKALLDPFDTAVKQLKVLDGEEDYTAGIKFRSVGSISCDDTDVTYVALIPGFSNCICFDSALETVNTPTAFPDHADSETNLDRIRKTRLVSAGLQLSLENAPDENEGYWEAVRVPFDISLFTVNDNVTDPTRYNTLTVTDWSAYADIANTNSFQTGKLRDLHRFQFKLNSRTDNHWFVKPSTVLADSSFDMVVIKIYGRRVSTSPSVLRYNAVSNQEIVYDESTIMARLQTKNERIDNIGKVLDKTDYLKPAVQIS